MLSLQTASHGHRKQLFATRKCSNLCDTPKIGDKMMGAEGVPTIDLGSDLGGENSVYTPVTKFDEHRNPMNIYTYITGEFGITKYKRADNLNFVARSHGG